MPISSTSRPRPAIVGRKVWGPISARVTIPKPAPSEPMKAHFKTRSSNRRRVSRPTTSTFCPSLGQWDIKATSEKSSTVEYRTRKR
jgi:hypothetical protein